jgi:thiamine monophosphate synthase
MKNLKTFLVGAASYLTVGQVVATASAKNPQPIGLQFAKDEGLLSAVLRVQRNFLP